MTQTHAQATIGATATRVQRVHRATLRPGVRPAAVRPQVRAAARAPHPRVDAPAGGTVRLTRRGRLTVLVVVVLALLVAFSAGRVMSSAATSGPVAPTTHTYVVEPGDTAWSIAKAAMPRVDGRLAVDRLLAMNHSDGQLRAGQTLVVPGS